MVYNTNDEHINRLRQMMARDGSIKQRIESQINRDAIDDYRDYRDSYRPSPSPNTSYSSKFRDPDLKIQTLTDKNEELTKKYSVLLKKTTLILEEYKKQEVDIKNIKIKLAKREKNIENIVNVKEIAKNIYNKIIVWFST